MACHSGNDGAPEELAFLASYRSAGVCGDLLDEPHNALMGPQKRFAHVYLKWQYAALMEEREIKKR